MPFSGPGSSSQLLRRYSEQLMIRGPSGNLESSLVITVEAEKAQESQGGTLPLNFEQVLSSLKSSAARDKARILEQETNKLCIAWNGFRKAAGLPVDADDSPSARLPELDTVCLKVTEQRDRIDQQAATSSGKIKKGLRTLCTRIQRHSNVLRVLPKDDKYVCLIAGSLITIVEAVAKYEEVADAIDELLANIEEDLFEQNEQLDTIFTMNACVYFVRLYVLWFDLLADVLDWLQQSRWKRARKVFDKDVLTNLIVEKQVKIRELQEKLRHEGLRSKQLELIAAQEAFAQRFQEREERLDKREKIDDERWKQLAQHLSAIGGQDRALHKLNRDIEGQKQILYELGCQVKDFLQGFEAATEATLGRQTVGQRTRSPRESDRVSGKLKPETRRSFEHDDSALHPSEDVLESLAPLRTAVIKHLTSLAELMGRVRSMDIDARVQKHLAGLLDSSRSGQLWIEGPQDADIPSQNSVTAAILTSLGRQKSLPCVKYFNSAIMLTERSDYGSEGYHEALLRDMILSLVMQLIMLIPEPRRSSIPLLRQNLGALRSATLPIVEGLRLLKALRLAGPPAILFVIEYFQILEGSFDEQYSTLLLKTIGRLCSLTRSHKRTGTDSGAGTLQPGNSTVTKVCFFTDGRMSALGDALNAGLLQRVDYDCESDRLNCGQTAWWSEDWDANGLEHE